MYLLKGIAWKEEVVGINFVQENMKVRKIRSRGLLNTKKK